MNGMGVWLRTSTKNSSVPKLLEGPRFSYELPLSSAHPKCAFHGFSFVFSFLSFCKRAVPDDVAHCANNYAVVVIWMEGSRGCSRDYRWMARASASKQLRRRNCLQEDRRRGKEGDRCGRRLRTTGTDDGSGRTGAGGAADGGCGRRVRTTGADDGRGRTGADDAADGGCGRRVRTTGADGGCGRT